MKLYKQLIREVNQALDRVTPSVESIARKHAKPVSYINKQLDQGIRVEKEHTADEKIAMEIALDHLNELPDYYTRLNRMEHQ